MADESTQKPKIVLRQTDTSRLKTEQTPGAQPPKPPAGETPPKVTLTKTDTSRLKAETVAGTAPVRPAVPPPAEPARPAQTVRLTDPMALRDTNTGHLRRIEPGAQTPGTGAAVAPGAAPGEQKKGATETVRLKVMREQKKETPPEAGQTARLRPPTVAVPPTGVEPAPKPFALPLADASKTVTIKSSIPPAVVEATKTQPAQPAETKTSTSKLTRVGGTTAAVEAPASADGAAHHTVKIKLPVLPEEPDEAGSPAATTVLPAPTEGAAATVKLPAEGGAQGAKRTIRMRSQKAAGVAVTPAEVATARAAVSTAAVPAAAAETDTVTTIALVVMILGLGVMLYFLLTQVIAHVL